MNVYFYNNIKLYIVHHDEVKISVIKIKTKKYHTLITAPKRKKGKIDTPNTQIHGNSLSWISTGMSEKSGGLN